MLKKVSGAQVTSVSVVRERMRHLTSRSAELTAESEALKATRKPSRLLRREPALTTDELVAFTRIGEELADIGLEVQRHRSRLPADAEFGLIVWIPTSGGDRDLNISVGLSEEPPAYFERAIWLTSSSGTHYYIFGGHIYASEQELSSEDATALLKVEELKHRQAIEQAKTLVALDGQVQAGERMAIPVAVRHLVMQRDEGACVVCGARSDLQFDHVIPIAMGGGNDPANLQVLCGSCNRRKSATLG